MSLENLFPTVTSMGGGFFAGILAGYFAKKIIKILMFITGGIVGLMLYLQQQQIISVDMERFEASLTFIFTSFVSFDKMTHIGDMTFLGIPLTASITAGFTLGLIKA